MRLFTIALVLSLAAAAQAQDVTCTAGPPVPLILRAESLAEPVSDIVLNCTGGTPGPSTPIDLTVESSTNLTSRILNATASTSEPRC